MTNEATVTALLAEIIGGDHRRPFAAAQIAEYSHVACLWRPRAVGLLVAAGGAEAVAAYTMRWAE